MPYLFVIFMAMVGEIPDAVDPWDTDNTKNIPQSFGGSPIPQPL